MSFDFEFRCPQFIESWENTTTIDDGADDFFDALDPLDAHKKSYLDNKEIEWSNSQQERDNLEENRIAKENNKSENRTEDVENITSMVKHECDDTRRRLSLKRKALPLKDKNECVPIKTLEIRKQKFGQVLSTIAESPLLLTKAKERVRLKPTSPPEKRVILKPVRKKNIGLCLKPLPKPPTVPVPFRLTEPGKNVHSCIEDSADKSACITPNRKPVKKKRTEMQESQKNVFVFKACPASKSNSSFNSVSSSSKENHSDCSVGEIIKHEFKAKEPTVLKKYPFWPEIESRFIQVDSAPTLTTERRALERKSALEEKKKKRAEEEKELYEEVMKVERELLRKLRKTMEFKATRSRNN